jgi:hypothetical protein
MRIYAATRIRRDYKRFIVGTREMTFTGIIVGRDELSNAVSALVNATATKPKGEVGALDTQRAIVVYCESIESAELIKLALHNCGPIEVITSRDRYRATWDLHVEYAGNGEYRVRISPWYGRELFAVHLAYTVLNVLPLYEDVSRETPF